MADSALHPASQDPTVAVAGTRRPIAGYAFVSGYVVLLLAFGVLPTAYALFLAFTKANGGFTGLDNFVKTASDFRFVPAFLHVAAFLAVWLTALVFFVVALALMLHGRAQRASGVLRFVYYLPGAVAGAASVLVWLFMLDPTVSPVGFLLRPLGFDSFAQVISPGHLPVIFAIIAFWTGAGGWIVVLYGALNNIPVELVEAARVDGANTWQIAIRIKLPMIRKWVAYMVILAFATGTQLFVEPQLVSEASFGLVSDSWSPNQLGYTFAFQMNNFDGAAAIAVDLLLLGLGCAAAIVFRTGLFEVE